MFYKTLSDKTDFCDNVCVASKNKNEQLNKCVQDIGVRVNTGV